MRLKLNKFEPVMPGGGGVCTVMSKLDEFEPVQSSI